MTFCPSTSQGRPAPLAQPWPGTDGAIYKDLHLRPECLGDEAFWQEGAMHVTAKVLRSLLCWKARLWLNQWGWSWRSAEGRGMRPMVPRSHLVKPMH